MSCARKIMREQKNFENVNAEEDIPPQELADNAHKAYVSAQTAQDRVRAVDLWLGAFVRAEGQLDWIVMGNIASEVLRSVPQATKNRTEMLLRAHAEETLLRVKSRLLGLAMPVKIPPRSSAARNAAVVLKVKALKAQTGTQGPLAGVVKKVKGVWSGSAIELS